MRLTSWLDSFALKARKNSARRARMSGSARRSRPAVCRLAVAEHLGVSRERVRQMAVKTDNPVRANEEGPGPKAHNLKRLR